MNPYSYSQKISKKPKLVKINGESFVLVRPQHVPFINVAFNNSKFYPKIIDSLRKNDVNQKNIIKFQDSLILEKNAELALTNSLYDSEKIRTDLLVKDLKQKDRKIYLVKVSRNLAAALAVIMTGLYLKEQTR